MVNIDKENLCSPCQQMLWTSIGPRVLWEKIRTYDGTQVWTAQSV